MKWSLSWLNKQKNGDFTFSEDLVFPHEVIQEVRQLLDLKEVHVEGKGHFAQDEQRLYIDLKISGVMIVSCAVSLEEVAYPFETESTEVFSFVKVDFDEDVHEVKKNTVDLTPIVFQNIVMEVPIRVVKEGAELKSQGNGWKVISEEEADTKPGIDPRLAKLKDYFKQ